LKEILRHAKYRHKVFHDWGYDRKITSGKGLSVLFSGPPGTGKTMVAGVLANELGMDLYKVDLSQVVSKYIGETEKNLDKVFQAAAGNQFIILFDEADSLFSKRTEVKSSVDRYANLEVNYLLQKMEEYSGMCVLTTNFEKSIDDAFKRRIQFRLDFPFPEPEDREQLWLVHLPEEAPIEGELNVKWLAEHYELAGGNIKNAVLRAAFRAAESDRPINIEDLEYAAERESREIGKLVQGVMG
jgi:SpoVK/Ycf46/Vps4 family AAA+-type ATPase